MAAKYKIGDQVRSHVWDGVLTVREVYPMLFWPKDGPGAACVWPPQWRVLAVAPGIQVTADETRLEASHA